jgi:hypothetical protein
VRKLLSVTVIMCGAAFVAAPAGAGEQDDQQIADEAGLVLADLPDGWESTPSDDLGQETGIDECEAIDRVNTRAVAGPHSESPQFTDPDDPEGATSVEGAVFVFPKAKGAKKFVAAYAADGARDCFQAIGDSQVEGFPESEVGTSDLDVEGGDDAVGYRLEIERTDDAGVTDTVVVDFVIVRQGRAVVSLGAQSAEEPPSLDDAMNAVLERLEQAL